MAQQPPCELIYAYIHIYSPYVVTYVVVCVTQNECWITAVGQKCNVIETKRVLCIAFVVIEGRCTSVLLGYIDTVRLCWLK